MGISIHALTNAPQNSCAILQYWDFCQKFASRLRFHFVPSQENVRPTTLTRCAISGGQKAHQILLSLDKFLVDYLASVDLACTEMGGLFHDGVCPTAE
jgi:hypothetical protein